ncbi:putative holin-like toxin [Ammoniphilus sp. YIM 78166]|nr:putative holin-like toxin [Ammoniphilus sp. YIM 78166]
MTVYEALNLLNGFGHLIATIILVVITLLSIDKK